MSIGTDQIQPTENINLEAVGMDMEDKNSKFEEIIDANKGK